MTFKKLLQVESSGLFCLQIHDFDLTKESLLEKKRDHLSLWFLQTVTADQPSVWKASTGKKRVGWLPMGEEVENSEITEFLSPLSQNDHHHFLVMHHNRGSCSYLYCTFPLKEFLSKNRSSTPVLHLQKQNFYNFVN